MVLLVSQQSHYRTSVKACSSWYYTNTPRFQTNKLFHIKLSSIIIFQDTIKPNKSSFCRRLFPRTTATAFSFREEITEVEVMTAQKQIRSLGTCTSTWQIPNSDPVFNPSSPGARCSSEITAGASASPAAIPKHLQLCFAQFIKFYELEPERLIQAYVAMKWLWKKVSFLFYNPAELALCTSHRCRRESRPTTSNFWQC